ncbi:MAG: ectoine synthase [Thiomicrorhabdus chilensis]|uniref:ectoine synthase n=1 Tax=Thiomicrorhabdus chilensis TaxID=63656 RepID=UPI0003F9DC9A|nr:ectoine synthase [Thiomicrorhabdus chilensis]MDX1347330.1 ectoine synthase [Thiomicrorhabdus chilensis]
MIVKNLYDDVIGTDADVDSAQWNSRRLLLASDGMGFSLHDTLIKAGEDLHLWYKNHLEAVYCIEGEGEIVEKKDGTVHPIREGTVYALNEHDQHILRANKGVQMRMVCVFNPPVTGREVHDEDGSYKLPE